MRLFCKFQTLCVIKYLPFSWQALRHFRFCSIFLFPHPSGFWQILRRICWPYSLLPWQSTWQVLHSVQRVTAAWTVVGQARRFSCLLQYAVSCSIFWPLDNVRPFRSLQCWPPNLSKDLISRHRNLRPGCLDDPGQRHDPRFQSVHSLNWQSIGHRGIHPSVFLLSLQRSQGCIWFKFSGHLTPSFAPSCAMCRYRVFSVRETSLDVTHVWLQLLHSPQGLNTQWTT